MKILLRLLLLLAPFWWLATLAILLGCVMVASNMLLLSMAAYVIAAAALEPLVITLTVPIYIVRFMSVSRSVSRYFERLLSHDVTFRLLARIRIQVYTHLAALLPARLPTYRSGDVLARLISDIDELQNVYLRMASPFIVAMLIAALTWGLFAIFSAQLAWTALAFLLLAGIGIPLLAGVLTRGLGRRQLAVRAELNAQIIDGIQGMQDLLACGSERVQQQKIADLDRILGQVQRRMAQVSGIQQAAHDLLMNLGLWTILILAIPLVVTKGLNGVYLAALTLLILASFEVIQPLAQAFQLAGHSIAAGERLFGVIDAQPEVIDSSTPLPAPQKQSTTEHMLEFEHVHFAYATAEEVILNDISFSVRPLSRIAIVGPSGSGKSTLISLVLRFWETTQGTIRLQGQDLRQYSLEDLRNFISVVSQNTYLFNDTVRNNVRLARPEADDQDVEQALLQAGLAEFVSQLPDGLDTWVGEQGLRLSGGERQRLAIARALLKDAPLLILDEATTNLDALTERTVLNTMDTLMRDRTTLIITHRFIDMERMDEILVLDGGHIIQRGTHAQLANVDGLYQQMLVVQNEVLSLL